MANQQTNSVPAQWGNFGENGFASLEIGLGQQNMAHFIEGYLKPLIPVSPQGPASPDNGKISSIIFF